MRLHNWKSTQLGDQLTFQRGFDITKKDQEQGPYPVVSSSGPNSTHSRFMVNGPGIVIGRKGTLGTVFHVTSDFWPHDTTLWVKDFHGNDSKFAYYFLKTMGFEQYDCGASNPTLNRNHIHTLPIKYPPLPTQRKIASILSAYDDLIENNTRRIAILESIAQAIYREWFVEFRFPGHENVKLVDSPLGMIPDRWYVKTLSDVAEVNSLSIKKGKEPAEVNYVDIAAVSTGAIDEVRTLTFAEAPGRARRIVRHGDIIWSTVRPNRKSYSLILNPPPNMIASTGFAVISGTKAPFTFLYYSLTTDEFVGYLVNHATGSAYPAVNSSDFETATILVATQNLLTAFHEATESMFLARHSMAEKNRSLRKIRDLLLPKLISGELDVEDLDIETGETMTE